MIWQSEKYVINAFAKTVRRIFKYTNAFENTGIEIMQFSSESIPQTYEQYAENSEIYPLISISGGGGVHVNDSLNSAISTYGSDVLPFVNESEIDKLVQLRSSYGGIFQLPSNLKGSKISGIHVNIITSAREEEIPLQCNLIANYNTIASQLATSSIILRPQTDVTSALFMFSSSVLLEGDTFWCELQSTSGTECYAGVDSSISASYYEITPFVTNLKSGSIAGGILLPGGIRAGGRFEGLINLRIQTKNDTSLLRNISDILTTRIILFRHASYSRHEDAVDNTFTSLLDKDVVPEWKALGISIKSVRESQIDMRSRGENDKIFFKTITVEYKTDWHVDYDGLTLTDIDVDVKSYLDGIQTSLNT